MSQRSKYILAAVLATVLLWPSGRARAAGPATPKAGTVKGISVSPALKEVTLSQDAPDLTFTFDVKNTTQNTLNLQLSTLDFGVLNETGGLAFIGRTAEETNSYGLKQWMVLGKPSLTLQPGEKQSVETTVQNKASLSPGGHYGAVIITATQDATQSKSVAVLPSASVLVLLKKTGGEVQDLKLSNVLSNHSIITLPKTMTLRFRNDGNVHAAPRGTVKLQDPFHKVIGEGIINESSALIFPESYRQFQVSYARNPKGWMPGRYSVITTWRYDGKTEPTTTVTHVWYLGLLPLIGLSIIVFLICLVFVQRRLSRKKRSKA